MGVEIVLTGLTSIDPQRTGCFVSSSSQLSHAPKTRFISDHARAPSELAATVVSQSLLSRDIDMSQVDCVISCTHSPDMFAPGLVSTLLAQFERTGIPGLEIRNMSPGPVLALSVARDLVRSGQASRVLVVACDFLARFFSPSEDYFGDTEIASAVFGEGCASFFVEEKNRSLPANSFLLEEIAVISGEPGSQSFRCERPAGSQYPVRFSVEDFEQKRHIPRLVPELLIEEGRRQWDRLEQEVDLRTIEALVSHQCVAGMNQVVRVAASVAQHDVFDSYGFVGAAGLPMALSTVPGTLTRIAMLGLCGSFGGALCTLRRAEA